MSNNVIHLGNLDMLRALYDFKASYAKTLTFKPHDYFILHQTNTKHKNWWQVINERGEVGFIPSNYVETVTVSPTFYLNFLDNCMSYVRQNDISPEYLMTNKEEILLRLNEMKRQLYELPQVKESIGMEQNLPSLLFKTEDGEIENIRGERMSSTSSISSVVEVKSGTEINNKVNNGNSDNGRVYGSDEEPIKPVKKSITSRESLQKSIENVHDEMLLEEQFSRKNPRPKESLPRESLPREILPRDNLPRDNPSRENVSRENLSKRDSDSRYEDRRKGSLASPQHANSLVKVSPTITQQAVYDLVESVRINTQLSYELSKVAVGTVIQGLHELLPANVFPYLSTILTHVEDCIVVDNVQINQTHDASRLKVIFNELTSCKEDSQQRSWMLHEDEGVITDYLSELLSILSNADSTISKYMLSSDDFNVITTLIQYYQMEIRWTIRQLLLQAFGVMCSLDKTIISIMLNSVLPGEIARDMTANPRNIAKLNYSVLLLTMIYSMGEPMPITDLQYLGEKFLLFMLNHIEYPPETDVDEQIPDMFVHFILSFNLQFKIPLDNVVMKSLSQRDVTKTFTEKILLLLNREEDPARIFDHEPAPENAVLKMFNDLFSNVNTADIFYTNDIKVLIDIVVRNISDLSPGEKRRFDYLELCRRVLRTTNYQEHLHRKDDLLKCFTRIFCEESDLSKPDQTLVKELLKEFPHYFE